MSFLLPGNWVGNIVATVYDKNYKSLRKETEEDIRRWQDLPWSWSTRINLEKNIRSILQNSVYRCNAIPISFPFLGRTSVAHVLRSTIDKWNLIKLQSFCKAKDTVNETKWRSRDWESIFTNPTPDRVLTTKMYKELKKLDRNNPKNIT